MAKKQIDAMLDAALDYIRTNGTELYLCAGEPADRAGAISASLIPAATPSYAANANGDVSGRKMTVQQLVDQNIDASGTADHVAICSGTTLLYVTTAPAQVLTSGGTITINAWDIEVEDVS